MVAVVELFKVVQQEMEDQVVEVMQVLVVVIIMELQVVVILAVAVVVHLTKVVKQLVEQEDQVLWQLKN